LNERAGKKEEKKNAQQNVFFFLYRYKLKLATNKKNKLIEFLKMN